MGKCDLPKMICAVLVSCIVIESPSSAQTLTTITNFDFTNGSGPNAVLVQGTDGDLYGTTLLGGSSNNCTDGCGTVFKITVEGTLTTLHNFDGADGYMSTGMVQGTDGNFYGTTADGGASSSCANGCGTVFKITPKGVLTTLHSFDGSDGSGPYSGLVQGTDGNFYGTTAYGGVNNSCASGCGTIFRITSNGELTSLHSFDGTDGSSPNGLIQGTDGNFYGTTFGGGSESNGTVFKITAKGMLDTLYNFSSTGAEGSGPSGQLVQATNGNLYGTTEAGGSSFNGTVFEITANGLLTTLHSFDYTDGDFPAGLVQGTDRNFYGTTQGGGVYFFGTAFKMTAEGTLTTLHNFDLNDGEDPQSPPVQATNGRFYGTTYFGGSSGYGTVFSLSAGLGAFVQTNPKSGKVGTKVTILGNDLASATSVNFNGTTATFKASSTYITTTVPVGATTGAVEVITPKKTLRSNLPFRVPW